MGKLTSKGKHTVKVGNHPHTRREYKCRIQEMHLKQRDQQLKTIFYIYRLLYQNLTGTTNQESTVETYTHKGKQSKHNTKDSHQITQEENKRGKEEKNLQKQSQDN